MTTPFIEQPSSNQPSSNQPSSNLPSSNLPSSKPGFVFFLPLILLLGLFAFSPNFQWMNPSKENPRSRRSDPFGADFLQDWIAGKVLLSEERNRLYDLSLIREKQHDFELVGFEWPEEKSFPMVYPPFYYASVSPISLVPYRWATYLWGVGSALALALTGWLCYRYEPLFENRSGWLMVGMTCFLPGIVCLTMGQKSTWILLLFTGTYLLLGRNRSFSAGLIFGLVAIKPQLGLVVGLVMLIKGNWKFALGSATTIGLLSGVSYWIEPQWWIDYIKVVSGMGDYLQSGGYQLNDSHSLWGGLTLLPTGMSSGLIKWTAVGLSLGLIGLIAWATEPMNGSGSLPRLRRDFSLMVLGTVLVSPHFYSYDLTILLLPMGLILFQNESKLPKWIIALLVLFYALSGSFASIAESTRIPLSILILLAVVLGLIFAARQKPEPAISK